MTATVTYLRPATDPLDTDERIAMKRRAIAAKQRELEDAEALAEGALMAAAEVRAELADLEAQHEALQGQVSTGAAWEDADRCTDCGHFPECDCPHYCTREVDAQ